MIKKIQCLDNMSMTVYLHNQKSGEIIHWQKTGMIESWHYNKDANTKKIQIAMFDEQHISDAICFAKYGEHPINSLERTIIEQ